MHRFTEVLAPFEYSCFHMLVPIKTKFLLCIHIFIFSHVHIFISFGIFLKMRYPKFHFQSKCLIFRFIHKDLNIANATVYWSIGTIWIFEHLYVDIFICSYACANKNEVFAVHSYLHIFICSYVHINSDSPEEEISRLLFSE